MIRASEHYPFYTLRLSNWKIALQRLDEAHVLVRTKSEHNPRIIIPTFEANLAERGGVASFIEHLYARAENTNDTKVVECALIGLGQHHPSLQHCTLCQFVPGWLVTDSMFPEPIAFCWHCNFVTREERMQYMLHCSMCKNSKQLSGILDPAVCLDCGFAYPEISRSKFTRSVVHESGV